MQLLEKRTEPLEQSPVHEMRLSPSGKRALVFAYEEAQALEHDHVGTEHLLLGLIREETGWAGRVLSGLGVELEQVRDAVRALSTEERGGSGKLRCVARESRDSSAKGPALDLDFDEMVAKYDGKLYGVLLRQTGDPGVAVGLTQQTFAHAYWHYEHFRGDKHVMTWLYQIARNLMRQRGM